MKGVPDEKGGVERGVTKGGREVPRIGIDWSHVIPSPLVAVKFK
jgi:hypothetical protein